MVSSAGYHARRQRVLAVNDKNHAEPIGLLFLKNGIADPDRENVEISAILRVKSTSNSNMDGGQSKAWKSRHTADKSRLAIDRASYAGPMPATGDKIKALSRAGEPLFEVLYVNDRDHARLFLELGEV